MNSICIMGRIGTTPEFKTTDSGIGVCSFVVAVDRPGTHGENKKTDWIDAVAWRNTGEFISRYFQKGSPIAFRGYLTTREKERDGFKRKYTEVVITEVEFVPRDRSEKTERKEEAAVDARELMREATEVTDFGEDLSF